MASLVLTPLWAQEGKFTADFEAPSYQPGSIHGQQGWSVDQGKADVLPGQGFQGSAGLVLRPVLPFSQARLSLEGKGAGGVVSFVDLRVRPIASEVVDRAELLDINSARVGLFREGSAGLAAVWVFDGDGKGGGGWVETSLKIPVDPASGMTRSWHRVTVREDIRRQTWDLWLDGAWLAAGLGFQEVRPAEAATCILMGDRKEPVALDDLGIAPVSPLGEDRDGDGLTDALEARLGFDAARDDRDEDADGDGVANLDHAVNQASAGERQPLTTARRAVAAPVWSVPPGLLEPPVTLSLQSATPGAAIRYTLDGSDPRSSGPGVRRFEQALDLSKTTIVRAAAVTPEGRWSGVVSGAWVSLDQVESQKRPDGWPEFFEDFAADQSPLRLPVPYEMLLNSQDEAGTARQSLKAALTAAPVVVLMGDSGAMFDVEEGLYSRSSRSAGHRVENVGVQVGLDGGAVSHGASLAISGGSSRYHDVTLKHSLRLQFDQPRTGGDGLPGRGKQLLLRHPTQDSWAVAGRWSGMRSSARYFTDGMANQWLASRGHVHLERRWVHVFLNEVYWGLYEAVEQPGPESTGGTLLESSPVTGTVPIYGEAGGWRAVMADALGLARKSRGGQAVDPDWEKLLLRLDAPGLVDYVALNLWLGNKDWPNRNYLISAQDGLFRFLSWDAEWVMPVEGMAPVDLLKEVLDASDGPAALFTLLCEAPAFRQLLRQRLGEAAGFHDAAFATLTEAAAAGVRPLLAAEAARWGAAYNPEADLLKRWEENASWIQTQWIPGRAEGVRTALGQHLQQIEANQAAAMVRLAGQNTAVPLSGEPVAFVADVPDQPSDRDGDGLPDAWELAHGLNPDDPSDASTDPDGDGLDNLGEYRLRRDPNRQDSPSAATVQSTGAFNRMEKPVIRRGKILDRARAEELKLGAAAAPAETSEAPASSGEAISPAKD